MNHELKPFQLFREILKDSNDFQKEIRLNEILRKTETNPSERS